jgi:thymidylate synthase (FAD)
MNIHLIAHTPDATKVVARAAHICTHADWPSTYDLHPDRSGPLVRRVLASGHDSILEHAGFTFAVDGISRACSHQLVRHRVASYSQQSQRYVESDIEAPAAVMPDTVMGNKDARDFFAKATLNAFAAYKNLIAEGIPAEDARFVLPNAATTKLVITMNARELHHFFALRCCNRAQWEIRAMAYQMLDQCRQAEPVLFEDCGPGCLRGPCPEGRRSCGKPPKAEVQGVRSKVKTQNNACR